MNRVRFVAATVALQLVNDDGDTLAAIPTQPVTVTADAWPPDLDAVIAQIDRQINPPPVPADEAPPSVD